MCNLKEAERHEQLAQIYLKENNSLKAIEHYLEATAIYVLNIELLKDENLLKKANLCYQQIQTLRQEKIQTFSKAELAQLTVKELKFPHHHDHSSHQNQDHSHPHFHNNLQNTTPHNHVPHDTTLSEIEGLL